MADKKDKRGFVMYKDWKALFTSLSKENAGELIQAIYYYQTGDEVEFSNEILKGVFEMLKDRFIKDDGKYNDTCNNRARAGSKGGQAKANNTKKEIANIANATNDIANSVKAVNTSSDLANVANASFAKNSLANVADKDKDKDLKDMYGHLPMTAYAESEGIVSQENTEEAGTDNVPEGTILSPDDRIEPETVPKSKPAYPKSFEEFWSAYPRCIGKGEAYKKYKARLNDGFSEQELITAAINYAQICKSEHTPDNYIKHPKTFLSDSTPFMDYVPKQAETARDEPKICNDDNPYAEWSRPKEDKP